MPYPDLEPSPTFWRCVGCGNEALFRASGIGTIACGACGKVSSEKQLLEAHADARGPASASTDAEAAADVVQPAQKPADKLRTP
jgi:hypothetical protein